PGCGWSRSCTWLDSTRTSERVVVTTTELPARPPEVHPRFRRRRAAVRRDEGRRRLRLLVGAVSVAALTALAWALTQSPMMDLDRVRVIGALHTPRGTVIRSAALQYG